MGIITLEKYDSSTLALEDSFKSLMEERPGSKPVCTGVIYHHATVSVALRHRHNRYFLPSRLIRPANSVRAALGRMAVTDIGVPEDRISSVLGLPENEGETTVAIEHKYELRRCFPLVVIVAGKDLPNLKNTEWHPYEEAVLSIGDEHAHTTIFNRFARSVADWSIQTNAE